MALAFNGRRRPIPTSLRLGSLLAAAWLWAAPAAAQTAPAQAPASRWTLPPPNVAMRSAMLGGTSSIEQTLINQGSILPRSTARPSGTSVSGAAASPRIPNVFGSVALAVSRTPLDGEWQRASAEQPLDGWTRQFADSRSGEPETLLNAVNLWVNDRIAFAEDASVHGEADHWSGAAETLRRGRGDCEDYALTKMQLLAELGLDRKDMYLVVVRDTLRQGDHAVLVVRLGDRLLVLDNLNDVLIDASALSDYRPMISYSAAGRWVHGFAADTDRTIQVASGFPRAAR